MTEISPEAWGEALPLLKSVNVTDVGVLNPSAPQEPADKQLDITKITTIAASNHITPPIQTASDKITLLVVGTTQCE